MGDIGLFFSSSTGNSETIARRISECFSPVKIDIHDIINTDARTINQYNKLILGIPTWNDKSMHIDWEEFLPKLKKVKFKRKKVAIFGLGDQELYSDNFVDDMGRLFDWMVAEKAKIVGKWKNMGYTFRESKALRENQFIGLALDEDNQAYLSDARVRMWVKQLINEFNF